MQRERATQVAALLARESYQALLCRLPEHVVMLTGYAPVLGNSLCIVSLHKDGEPECRLLVPEDEADLVPNGAAVEVLTFAGETLDHIGSALQTIAKPLCKLLRAAGLRPGRGAVGYEGGRHPLVPGYTQVGIPSVAMLTVYEQALPGVQLRDASDTFAELAAIKIPRDIAGIRQAIGAASEGFVAARATIRIGVPESHIAAVLTEAVLHAAYGSSRTGQVQAHAHVMSGARSALAYRPFNLTSAQPIQQGQPVLVQLEVCIDGYWAEMTRTFFAGEPHLEWLTAYRACLRAQEAALAAIRPGVQASEVDAAARSVLREAGFGKAFRHGLGHGVGFQAINHAAAPVLHPASQMRLLEGMVHNMEPAVYLEGQGGLRLNDDVLVKEYGPELLTAMIPRTLDWLLVGQ